MSIKLYTLIANEPMSYFVIETTLYDSIPSLYLSSIPT